MSMSPCPLCGAACTIRSAPRKDAAAAELWLIEIRCEICGVFLLMDGLQDYLQSDAVKSQREILQAFIRTQNRLDEYPTILSNEDIESIVKNAPSYSPQYKMQLLLSELGRYDFQVGYRLSVYPETDYPLIWARDSEQYVFYLQALVNKGFIEYVPSEIGILDLPPTWKNGIRITIDGWNEILNLRQSTPLSKIGFCAMHMDKSMDKYWHDAISPAILEAGFNPIRASSREENNNAIDDQIIADIRAARFLVADVTNARPNVYYEAGFAYGLGKTVLWSCNATKAQQDMHFDTRQFPHIIWENETDLKDKLIKKIKAVIV